jgi:geranylgeranyl diphosphate synthase type II
VACDGFDVGRYLFDCKALVDRGLAHYLKRNRRLRAALDQAVCYSVLDGGKRFRPILTIAAGDLFRAKRSVLLPFACAIEFVHCYSLIHDDLPAMDNDDFRRGKPSCHKQFGEAIALLAGDALLTEAFFIMSNPRAARALGGSLSAKLIREVANAAGRRGMIRGQSAEIDLIAGKATPAVLEGLDRLKTGALITAAVRVGAMVGGGARSDLERLTRYAQSLGLSFQITDDMMDVHEGAGNGNDHEAMVNYSYVAGRAQAAERVENLLSECLKALEGYGAEAEPLRALARFVARRTAGDPADEEISKPEQRPVSVMA